MSAFSIHNNPTPDALLHSGAYVPVATLSLTDITPMMQKWLRQPSLVSRGYWIVNAFFLGVLVYLWLDVPFGEGLTAAGLGVAVGYLLLFPHEYLHALAYRVMGAQDVSIRYQWRRFVAYCGAHHAVLDGRQFVFLAILPFIVITLVLGLAAFLFPAYAVFLTAMIFFHATLCSGDFALLNLVWLNREAPLYTFDDLERQESYFFRSAP